VFFQLLDFCCSGGGAAVLASRRGWTTRMLRLVGARRRALDDAGRNMTVGKGENRDLCYKGQKKRRGGGGGMKQKGDRGKEGKESGPAGDGEVEVVSEVKLSRGRLCRRPEAFRPGPVAVLGRHNHVRADAPC